MSSKENAFIKWVGGIAAALIIAGVLGLIGMSKSQVRMEVNLETQKQIYQQQLKSYQDLVRQQFMNQITVNSNFEKELNEMKEIHKDDIALIRGDIKDVKRNQDHIRQFIENIKKQ